MTDKARDEARIDFLARKTPDNYIHGSHLLLATFEIGFKAAWDHLWRYWEISSRQRIRILRKDGGIRQALEELSTVPFSQMSWPQIKRTTEILQTALKEQS